MDLVLYTLAEEELIKAEKLIEETLPKIEAFYPEYMKIYNKLSQPAEQKDRNLDLKSMYREASLRAHPDKGGDPEVFKELSSAYKKGDVTKFTNAYNKAMGKHTEVLLDLKNTNGYKWSVMYSEGRIDEVRQEFLKHLLNEIYTLETKK